ncbi:unnamed protein product [Ilex paraguariensis]|uniref:Uncharacterized protein n=1 Tax=Ilex paraguariensis TaxID=185542 RepID=A0ABC8SJG4_9AQUA
MQRGVLNSSWRSEDTIYNKFPNINLGIPSPSSSSSGMLAVGQVGSYVYGSVAMEKSFRDCSISAGGHSFGLVGVDPYPTAYPFLEKRKSDDGTLEEKEQEEQNPEIETLPVFPMHGDNISGFCNMKPESENYYTGWYRSHGAMAGSRASLELSLNSYTGRSPDSP